jgi:hypothetical protein
MTPKEFPMPPTAEEMAAHRLQGALLFAPQTRGQIDSQFARKPLSFNELPSHVADISVDASDSAESVDIYLPSAAFSVPIPWRWSLAVRSLRLEHSQNQLDHMAWAIAVKMCQALNPGFPADVERGTTSTALFAIEGQGIEAKLPAGAWLERCASLMATHGIEVVRPFLEAGVVTALECILDYSTTDLVFGSGHPSSKQKAFMSRISKSVDCVPTVADRLNIRDASEYISRHLEQFNEAETARWSGAPVLPEV